MALLGEEQDWAREKLSYAELRRAYEGIDPKVQTALSKLVYHMLPKVAADYREILGIELFDGPEDTAFLCKAVAIRHNIEHRNGCQGAHRHPVGRHRVAGG